MSFYSDCCNAPTVGNSSDYGLCAECKEHCEFWDDTEEECPECYEFVSRCECKPTEENKDE